MNNKVKNSVTYASSYQVIWCSKYRRPVLNEEIARRLEFIVKQVCLERQAELRGLQIEPDHLVLELDIDPQFGIHRLVKQIKASSSKQLRAEYKELRTRIPTLWTNNYFVATKGGSAVTLINNFLAQQKHV